MQHSVSFCFLIGLLFQVLFLHCVSHMKCWQCMNAASFMECEASGNTTDCARGEVCSTEVRQNYNDINIWKGCKQINACENQRLQNWKRTPHICNNDQSISHCWCCCDSDWCNTNETCEVTATKCPMPKLHMDHGDVTCSNANHLGSLCTYRCSETGYHGLPLNKQDRLCLGNGKWSEKKPCCVKECPPYVPLDLVAVVQYASQESFNKRVAGFAPICSKIIQGEDYYQAFRVFFNEKVYNVVPPENINRAGYYLPSANNTVNTGAALRYVRDNILWHLHRRNSHSDVIYLGVEKESDDDVTKPAADLKQDGVTIYYVFFESVEHNVNLEEARAVATSEEHIFVVDGEKKVNFRKLLNDMLSLACNYPCPTSEDD